VPAGAVTVGPVTVNATPPINCVSLNLTSQSHGTLINKNVCVPLPAGSGAVTCTATGTLTFVYSPFDPALPSVITWMVNGTGTCTELPSGDPMSVSFSGSGPGGIGGPCDNIDTNKFGFVDGVNVADELAVNATFVDQATGARVVDSEIWDGPHTYAPGVSGQDVPGAEPFAVRGASSPAIVGGGVMRPTDTSPCTQTTDTVSFAWGQTT
jgi:hypothetical protein